MTNQLIGEEHLTKDLSTVTKEIKSNTESQDFWWDALGHSLATLLQTSQYGDDEHIYYLQWFQQWILPALGPRPINGKPHYGSWLTYDGSPLEYSLNWKEKKSSQTIRFTIEPTSRHAGTAVDRLNQQSAKGFLTSMAKDVPGVDLTRFNLFLSETQVPEDAANEVLSKMPSGAPLTRVWVAFDLERGGVTAKAYFLPGMKAIYTGIPAKTIVFDAVRKCNGPAGSYNGSLAVLDSYLESFTNGEAPEVVLLSNDCVDSPGSRIKIYVHGSVDTLTKAKDMFHLGGRLSGSAVSVGLKALSEFWCHLFELSTLDPDIEDKEVLADGRKCLFVYEIRPTQNGQKVVDMEVKIHIPAWRLGKTDAQLSELLAAWFRGHGHDALASKYHANLALAFPQHDLSTTGGTHTWISLTYTHRTGLYMTMYYTPKLPEMCFRTN